MDIDTGIDYRGYTITVHNEQGADNPYEAFDGMPPLVCKSWDMSRSSFTDYGGRDVRGDLLDLVTDNQLIRHQRAILAMAGDAPENAFDDDYTVDDKVDELRNLLVDLMAGDYSDTDWDDAVVYVAGLSKTPVYSDSSHGYSQGDYVEYVVVCFKDWADRLGVPKRLRTAEHMKDSVSDWRAWLWGDVYWYEVEDKDGRFVDSCSGFYIEDPFTDDNHMLEDARSAIDGTILSAARQRTKKLKELLRARVPLDKRADILAHAA